MLTKYTTVVFILSYFRYGACIRCYECNSLNNSMCLEPNTYDKQTLQNFLPSVECGHGVYTAKREDFFCRKIIQTVIHKGYFPDVRVTRGCGWVRSHRECYKADNEDHLETVCQCFSDGCNSGAAIQFSVRVIATALGVLGLKLF